MRVAIIGAGSVGTAVGILLQRRGYKIAGVASRTLESARRAGERLKAPFGINAVEVVVGADLIFLTTSDSAIAGVAAEVAERGGFVPGQTVLHMSGSLTTEELAPAKARGAMVLSVHPLQSCASAERGVQNLPGSVFSIEGDEEAFPLAERLVRDLGGEFFYINKEIKPLYHAAACVASNYLVTLVDLSNRLMEAAGMPPELGSYALLPLIQGTLANIQQMGIPRALTGPVARGDVATVREHVSLMLEKRPDLTPLYAALGYYTASLAAARSSAGAATEGEFQKVFGENVKKYGWPAGGRDKDGNS